MSQDAFFRLAEALCVGLQDGEVLFCALDGEDSDFVRLNQGRIRQAGSVQSQGLGLTLIQGARQIDGGCDLAGDPTLDLAQGRDLLARLRERLPETPRGPLSELLRHADPGGAMPRGRPARCRRGPGRAGRRRRRARPGGDLGPAGPCIRGSPVPWGTGIGTRGRASTWTGPVISAATRR